MIDLKLYEEFEDRCVACKACPLHEHRQHVVVDRWSTENATGKLLFCGEAPGQQEDEQGLAFVGPSGDILDEFTAAQGINDYVILNVLKCRPPRNKFPGDKESPYTTDVVDKCVELWLDRQLELLQPKVVVCVGKKALAWTVYRGHGLHCVPTLKQATDCWYRSSGYPGVDFVCMYHPAYLLRQRRADKESAADIEFRTDKAIRWARRLLEGRKLRGISPKVVTRPVPKPKQQSLFG